MGGLAGRCTRSSHYSNAVSPRLGRSRRDDWEYGYNWAHGHTAAVRVAVVARARKIKGTAGAGDVEPPLSQYNAEWPAEVFSPHDVAVVVAFDP